MNYGYWDDSVRSRGQALFRLYQRINEQLKLGADDLLLDAGCGLGEASRWFAENTGSRVVGITVSPSQVRLATGISGKQGLMEKNKFMKMDYTRTNFEDKSFDAVIAIETICHLADKADFYREAFRLLKPGGELVVAEYTLLRPAETAEEKAGFPKFLRGWKIPNLWTRTQHEDSMEKAGFIIKAVEDYSDKTTKTSRYLYWYSVFGIPFYLLCRKTGMIDDIRLENAVSCKYQWTTKRGGLWGHFLYTAVKG